MSYNWVYSSKWLHPAIPFSVYIKPEEFKKKPDEPPKHVSTKSVTNVSHTHHTHYNFQDKGDEGKTTPVDYLLK